MKSYPTVAVKKVYSTQWHTSAASLAQQDGYQWMAERLREFAPKKILDIGCGTGEGIKALWDAFHPNILSIEENPFCLEAANCSLKGFGVPTEKFVRGQFEDHEDGTHSTHFTMDRITRAQSVSLVQGDWLVLDASLLELLEKEVPFDAVTVWLIGSDAQRSRSRGLPYNMADPKEYRFRVQNRAYEIAASALKPGGILHVCDRGGWGAGKEALDNLKDNHEEQASVTPLEVFRCERMRYNEANAGIKMMKKGADIQEEGDSTELGIYSVLSWNPN